MELVPVEREAISHTCDQKLNAFNFFASRLSYEGPVTATLTFFTRTSVDAKIHGSLSVVQSSQLRVSDVIFTPGLKLWGRGRNERPEYSPEEWLAAKESVVDAHVGRVSCDAGPHMLRNVLLPLLRFGY